MGVNDAGATTQSNASASGEYGGLELRPGVVIEGGTLQIRSEPVLFIRQGERTLKLARTEGEKNPLLSGDGGDATSSGGGGGLFGGGGGDGAAADSDAYRAMRGAVKTELGSRFRPEFLNRLDEVVVFSSLDRAEVTQVAQLMLDEVAARSADNGLPLRFSDNLKATLVDQGFSSTYGARPLRRAVQRVIEDPVAEAVLDGFAADGQLDIDVSRDGALLLTNKGGQQRTVEMRKGMGIEDDFGEPAAAPGPVPMAGLEEALRLEAR